MREIKIAAHSEKEYIFSGEETLSYGLKGKKAQERKTGSQERSTRKKNKKPRKKHKKEAQNNIQHEIKPNHEKQHVQASKRKNIQRKGKFPLPASPHPVSSFQVRSIVLPALRCTF